MSDDVIHRLFHDFNQADVSTARRYGGTGLGLSIAKRLVEQMSGEIGLFSIPGEGSTFWFSVRLKPGLTRETQKSDTTPRLEFPRRKKPWRVLIADDNEVNQLITSKMVEKMGLQHRVVANGREALEAVRNEDFDVVLMDCHMPEMDGYEATRLIRAENATRNSTLPIIAITAGVSKEDLDQCFAVGMDDHVTKPITFAALQAALFKWIQKISKTGTKKAS